jgi:hypothetical protein
MSTGERRAFMTASGLGVLLVLWTTHLGGTIVYEYGGGGPTSVREGALQEREREHAHEEESEPHASMDMTLPDSDATAAEH